MQNDDKGFEKTKRTGHIVSAINTPIVGIADTTSRNAQPVPEDVLYYNLKTKNRLNRETFLHENEALSLQEKSAYFEWLIIAIFLIILASGIFLLKPHVEPVNEYKSPPFEFSKITDPVVSQPSGKN